MLTNSVVFKSTVLAEENNSNSTITTITSRDGYKVFSSLTSSEQREIIRQAAAEEGIYIPKYPDRGAANSAFKIAQFILKNRTKVTNVIRIFPIFARNCYNMGKQKESYPNSSLARSRYKRWQMILNKKSLNLRQSSSAAFCFAYFFHI